MKLSDMKTAGEVLAEDLEKDPEFRNEWSRTALAREVANYVLAHRVRHRLTQEELGRRLGMKQSAVARLETGEHEPTFTTLSHLAQGLGVEFHIDITSQELRLSTSAEDPELRVPHADRRISIQAHNI